MIKLKTIKGKHYVTYNGEVLEFRELRSALKFIFLANGLLNTAK